MVRGSLRAKTFIRSDFVKRPLKRRHVDRHLPVDAFVDHPRHASATNRDRFSAAELWFVARKGDRVQTKSQKISSVGAPCWVEALEPDPRAAADFYGALLGWECGEPGPMPDGCAYYVAALGGLEVAGIAQLPRNAHPQWTTYVRVDNVEAASRHAVEAGGAIVVPALDAAPAGRLGIIADPSGATLGLWQAQAREGAQRVEGPGAWAMSTLRTSDLDGAARFYAAVFRWTAEVSTAGPTHTMVFRLPGFVSARPQQQLGSDVVAYATEIAASEKPAWGVAFWTDDVEAAVRRAVERGGRVLVGPINAGAIRRVVIADPSGAICTLNQLVAERSEGKSPLNGVRCSVAPQTPRSDAFCKG